MGAEGNSFSMGLKKTVALALLTTALVSNPAIAQQAPGASGPAQGGTNLQDPPVVQKLNRILVEGNRRVDVNTIQAYITVEIGDPVTAGEISESVRRLYDTGLFEDISISPLGDALLVQVKEAPFINQVAFEGNDTLDDETLASIVTTTSRSAFSRSRAERDTQALLEVYRRTGRYGATIEPKLIERPNNRVDLVFEINEGEQTGVEAIEFVGNKRFSDSTLSGEISTRESGWLGWLRTSDVYDPDRLEVDKEMLRNFYLNEGYADFEVLSATAELTADRSNFIITFTVDEGKPYTLGDVEVETSLADLDPEELRDSLDLPIGEQYSAGDIDKAVDQLIAAAGDKGYAFVDVRPRAQKDPENQIINITLEIGEGPRVYVERIEIEGNSRTVDRVLRRQFSIAEGDAFNRRKINEAQDKLRALGYFSKVDVATKQGSAEDRAVVRVNVEEQLTGSISFGLGYSSADGILGDISITERNFLGRGQIVTGRIGLSGDEQAYEIGFTEPSVLDRDLAAGFRLGYTSIDRDDESSFEETNFGFRPFMEFPLSDNQRLRLRYRISSDEIRNVSDSASPAVAADEGTDVTSSVGFTYSYDRRNSKVEPTEGFLLRANEDLAGLGGDTQYSKTSASAKGYTSFFDQQVIATLEVEGGAILGVGKDTRITDRYFLGGDDFRGFANYGIGPRDNSFYEGERRDDALGGNYYAVMRADVTFPLGLPEEFGIYGGVFSDVGTIWGLDQTSFYDSANNDELNIDDKAYLRASVGASLFIDSPLGPLRFNWAYPLKHEKHDDREYFRFTVGTRF